METNEITTADAIERFEKLSLLAKKNAIEFEKCFPGLKNNHWKVKALYDIAIDALRAQAEAEKNEPLTLEELQDMVGEPVWVTHKDGSGGRWGIVNIYQSGICADVCSRTAYWFEDFIGNMAYRRKPENGRH